MLKRYYEGGTPSVSSVCVHHINQTEDDLGKISPGELKLSNSVVLADLDHSLSHLMSQEASDVVQLLNKFPTPFTDAPCDARVGA